MIKYSVVTVGPSVEPVSLVEAKLQCKIDDTAEDTLIDIWRQSAREIIEDRTNRSLITQTRILKLEHFPCGAIVLSNGPVQSVTSVKYYDNDDVEQTMSASDYWVDTHGNITRVVVKNAWPATKCRPSAVTVTYVAGYGATAATVPGPLKSAMLLLIGHFNENRQENSIGAAVHALPEGVERLISTYVVNQDASQ